MEWQRVYLGGGVASEGGGGGDDEISFSSA